MSEKTLTDINTAAEANPAPTLSEVYEVQARGNRAILAGAVIEESNNYYTPDRVQFIELLGEGGHVAAIVANINDKGTKSNTIVLKMVDGEPSDRFTIGRNFDDETTYKQLPVKPIHPDVYAGGTYNVDVMAQKPVERNAATNDMTLRKFIMMLEPGEDPADRFYEMARKRLPVPMLPEWRHAIWGQMIELKPVPNQPSSGVKELACVGMAPTFTSAYRVSLRALDLQFIITGLGRSGLLGYKPVTEVA